MHEYKEPHLIHYTALTRDIHILPDISLETF